MNEFNSNYGNHVNFVGIFDSRRLQQSIHNEVHLMTSKVVRSVFWPGGGIKRSFFGGQKDDPSSASGPGYIINMIGMSGNRQRAPAADKAAMATPFNLPTGQSHSPCARSTSQTACETASRAAFCNRATFADAAGAAGRAF